MKSTNPIALIIGYISLSLSSACSNNIDGQALIEKASIQSCSCIANSSGQNAGFTEAICIMNSFKPFREDLIDALDIDLKGDKRIDQRIIFEILEKMKESCPEQELILREGFDEKGRPFTAEVLTAKIVKFNASDPPSIEVQPLRMYTARKIVYIEGTFKANFDFNGNYETLVGEANYIMVLAAAEEYDEDSESYYSKYSLKEIGLIEEEEKTADSLN
ncbi:MAG: hypothetical protein NXI09_11670 [Bacteroidetes bacterium]|nr:hypothetical protein [Bacteroidota bacterium]